MNNKPNWQQAMIDPNPHITAMTARLNRGELDLLIKLVCSVDGQAAGTTRPHPDSKLGPVLAKLEVQRKLLD